MNLHNVTVLSAAGVTIFLAEDTLFKYIVNNILHSICAVKTTEERTNREQQVIHIYATVSNTLQIQILSF